MDGVLEESVSPLVSHVPGAANVVDDETTPTAAHYGDPLVEQQRLSRSVGITDRWDRTAILVKGEETHTWLNDLISQKINAIEPGQATYGLLLDIQGRVTHQFGIASLPEGILLDCPMRDADSLADYLTKMIFWARVEVEVLQLAQLTLVSGLLPDSDAAGSLTASSASEELRAALGSGEDAAGAKGLDSNSLVEAILAIPGAHSWRMRSMAAVGNEPSASNIGALDIWVPRGEVTAAWDVLSEVAAPAGRMAYDALRIAAHIPEVGIDTDERTIPHEAAFFTGPRTAEATKLGSEADGPSPYAVHLNKGCYRGQETVSRVQNLGKPPRVIVLVHLDGSANRLPAVGSDFTAGGKVIGRVGSSAHDGELGPIALALVKRGIVEKLASDPKNAPALQADGVDATIDPADLVRDDAERPGRAAINQLRSGPQPR
ncbi:folate-binding protein YgfZ [uncultured Corynebacterium sp.]|uniref:CAF17-like 4Fe-4S cluster assembly/insertion protein YgfZ n=1 Tax=uncultured Corynebacterium sp. TaxID=159447 RepID=UPI0025EE37FC|nr:folate-binding protein [uncultured Corynebacterium sp.]